MILCNDAKFERVFPGYWRDESEYKQWIHDVIKSVLVSESVSKGLPSETSISNRNFIKFGLCLDILF